MKKVGIVLLALVPAVIFVQTLWFKFTASPESVYIFTTIGIEPWGRIMTGIFELIAAVLLVIPGTRPFGAILGLGIMAGAIVSHLTILGIEVQQDGGLLFVLATVSAVCSLALIIIERQRLIRMIKR